MNDAVWSLPKMYRFDSFARRRFVSCFRLNSIWTLPIVKYVDEADVYQCSRCRSFFNKKLTWKHFIYDCPEVPRCTMISRPDPLSPSAFLLCSSAKSNPFKERIISVMTFLSNTPRNAGVASALPDPSRPE